MANTVPPPGGAPVHVHQPAAETTGKPASTPPRAPAPGHQRAQWREGDTAHVSRSAQTVAHRREAQGMSGMAALRRATDVDHKAIGQAPFIARLASGHVNEASYTEYLCRLLGVYEQLEGSLERCADSLVKRAAAVGLDRRAALRADIAAWGGAPATTAHASVQSYVQAIERAAGESPALLLAHWYVRTFGDLMGGQIISQSLGKSQAFAQRFGSSTDLGRKFYNFDSVLQGQPARALVGPLVQLVEEAIARVGVERFVAEAKAAYALNQELVKDLA